MQRWFGKVAVVTGAASGIGKAVSTALVRNGLKVVGFDVFHEKVLENAETLRDEPGQLRSVRADVTKGEEIAEAFRWTKENVGSVSILINNAGTFFPTNLVDGDEESLRRTIEVNVLANCMVAREAIREMKESGIDGHVINVCSRAGHIVPNYRGFSFNIYTASKHAVKAMTETLRLELREQGSKIKISAVSPGMVRTGLGGEEVQLRNKIPFLEPEDVADAIQFVLATPPHFLIEDVLMRNVSGT